MGARPRTGNRTETNPVGMKPSHIYTPGPDANEQFQESVNDWEKTDRKLRDSMTVLQVATRINGHLKRFSAMDRERFRDAGAYAAHNSVRVRYTDKTFKLGRPAARDYLRRLDSGFTGTHFE